MGPHAAKECIGLWVMIKLSLSINNTIAKLPCLLAEFPDKLENISPLVGGGDGEIGRKDLELWGRCRLDLCGGKTDQCAAQLPAPL